jgi:predicted ATP-binding protein involved in virulence
MEIDNLKDKKEIYIVGENGDGKTLFLQSILVGLAGVRKGEVFELFGRNPHDNPLLLIETNNSLTYSDFSTKAYLNILAYGASRNNYCNLKEDDTGYLTLFSGEYDLKSPIKWLIELYNAQNAKEKIVISLDDAIKLLQYLLNKEIEIEVNYRNVTFKEKKSKEVSFDQLSAGYKGVITIICDLIARLSEKQEVKNITNFQGVVLIDEVELHLHPKWKYNFMKKLRDTFPLIQFIVTTHSPTVILGASKEAVFYKIYKEEGEVKISNQIPNRGYTNNTLISSPLFDLDTMTSRSYDKRKLSEDDYVYELIHEVVSQKIKEDINLDEEAILKLIEEEFDKHDKN